MDFRKPGMLNLSGNLDLNFQFFKKEMEIYFIATELLKKNNSVQVAILKNLMGPEAFRLYEIIKPKDLKDEDETVVKVFEILQSHCCPKKNITMEIFKFFSRKQGLGENFEKFYTDLKGMVTSCDFGTQEEKLLKAQIILGVNSRNTQEKLLREELNLEKMVSFCNMIEITERNLEILSENKMSNNTEEIFSCSKSNRVQLNYNKKYFQDNDGNNPKLNSKSVSTDDSKKVPCSKCGSIHGFRKCPAYGKHCYKCNLFNHFAKMCKREVKKSFQVNDDNGGDINEDEPSLEPSLSYLSINPVQTRKDQSKQRKQWWNLIKVCNKSINFKLDSGAEVNIIPVSTLKQINSKAKIVKTKVKLQAYGGFEIHPLGTVNLKLESNNKILVAEFIVVKENNCCPILGLQTCLDLELIQRLNTVKSLPKESSHEHSSSSRDSEKDKFINKNRDVFDGLGCFPDVCHLILREDAVPKSFPARRVPLKIKDKLKKTLDDLVDIGVIVPVNEPCEWVNNLVIIEKPDSSLRLCIDPQHLNKYLLRDYYEIPKLEDLSVKLANKKYFCLLDLKNGFHQIVLDDSSSKLCSFSTPFGIYRYLRAPFGLSVLPEYFQKLTSKYFSHINGVVVYFDDILCAADTKEELDLIIAKVFDIAREKNVKFNSQKLQYCVDSVKFVGFIFNRDGYKPDPERVQSIKNLKAPKNKNELQQILGIINFLRNFLPNLSDVISPLRDLLKNHSEWLWTKLHDERLEKIKQMVSNITQLSFFDPSKPVEVQADASKDALGCALIQGGKPIVYASRSLTQCESNYAQIEKELLAITFSYNKFHNYLYGHKNVTVYTDHAPLTAIIKKDICQIKNNRLRRLRIKLLPYTFLLKYLPGKHMVVADLLSRNYKFEESSDDISMSDYVHTVGMELSFSSYQLERFQQETMNDEILSKVINYYEKGWPNKSSHEISELNYYIKMKNDITVEDELVYINERLVIPQKLREFIVNLLHETHLGLEKIKKQASTFFYWPGMSSHIRNAVSFCKVCQRFQRVKIKETLLPHEIPDVPFYKVALDIAEYCGNNYLVLVDYYSRWIEVEQIRNKSVSAVINILKPIFAKFGIPHTVVADNNPFNSLEFREFCKKWNFQLTPVSPLYPKSNGLVEKSVGTVKSMLKKCDYEKQDFNMYLLNYRNCPVAGLNYSPAQLLMSRHLRSKIPIKKCYLSPTTVKDQVVTSKLNQEYSYNKNSKKVDVFAKNEKVLVYDKFYKIWEEGEILEVLPFRSYLVKVKGKTYRRNSWYIRKYKTHITKYYRHSHQKQNPSVPVFPNITPHVNHEENESNNAPTPFTRDNERPKRIIKKPDRLNL